MTTEATLEVLPVVVGSNSPTKRGGCGEERCIPRSSAGERAAEGVGDEEEDEDDEYDDSASDLDVELFDEWLEEETDDLPDDELFAELSSDDDEPPLHHQLLMMSLRETQEEHATKLKEQRKTIGTTAESGAATTTTASDMSSEHENVGRRRSERVRSTRGNTTSNSDTQPLSSPPPFRSSNSLSTIAVEQLKERMGSAALGKMRERAASKAYSNTGDERLRKATSKLGVTLQLPNGLNTPMTLKIADNITVEQMKALLFQKSPSLKMLDPTQFYIGIDESTVFMSEKMDFLKCHPTVKEGDQSQSEKQFKIGIYPKLNEGSNKDRNVGSLPLHALKGNLLTSPPSSPSSASAVGTPRRHQLQIGNRTAR